MACTNTCYTKRLCTNTSYTDWLCTNTCYTKRLCTNTSYTDWLCTNTCYTKRLCINTCCCVWGRANCVQHETDVGCPGTGKEVKSVKVKSLLCLNVTEMLFLSAHKGQGSTPGALLERLQFDSR